MDRREAFEKDWSQRYSMTAEEVRAHRFADQDGYDLPLLAAHYRTWCAAIESVVVELPYSFETYGEYSSEVARIANDCCADAIAAAGIKVAP